MIKWRRIFVLYWVFLIVSFEQIKTFHPFCISLMEKFNVMHGFFLKNWISTFSSYFKNVWKKWEGNKSDFCLFKVASSAVSRWNVIQVVNEKKSCLKYSGLPCDQLVRDDILNFIASWLMSGWYVFSEWWRSQSWTTTAKERKGH